jgi:hypothetical protein
MGNPGVPSSFGSGSSDQLLGNLIYNLACAYALNGDADRAIATLQEVVRLHPALTTLAREDADFAAIRVLPEFQAIVGG